MTFLTQTIERARAAALTCEPANENVATFVEIGNTITALEALKKTLLRHR